jgi:hypothetical protein
MCGLSMRLRPKLPPNLNVLEEESSSTIQIEPIFKYQYRYFYYKPLIKCQNKRDVDKPKFERRKERHNDHISLITFLYDLLRYHITVKYEDISRYISGVAYNWLVQLIRERPVIRTFPLR